jgi:hypothetical protein
VEEKREEMTREEKGKTVEEENDEKRERRGREKMREERY